VQDMLADLNRVSATMQDVAGIVGRLPETSGDEHNEEKCSSVLSLDYLSTSVPRRRTPTIHKCLLMRLLGTGRGL